MALGGLESLFEDSLKPAYLSEGSAQSLRSLEPYKNVEILRNMIGDINFSITDSWKFFVHHFVPRAQEGKVIPPRVAPSYLRSTGQTLLKQIIQAKSDNDSTQSLPPIAEVIGVYFELGMLRGSDWVLIMFGQLSAILKEDQQGSDTTKMLMDLADSWKVVCARQWRARWSQSDPLESPPYGDWNRKPLRRDVDMAYQKQRHLGLFGVFLPSFSENHLTDVPLIAAATYGLLTKPHVPTDIVEQTGPLLLALRRIFRFGRFTVHQLTSLRSSAPLAIKDFVKAEHNDGFITVEDSKLHSSHERASSPRIDGQNIQKRLRDALARRDPHLVERLWKEVAISSPEIETSAHAPLKRGALTGWLCNHFLMTYMALGKPDQAIDIWNYMTNSGLLPTLATWDSMMVGCKVSRDVKALEGVWNRMLRLGFKPDVVCWTTRISGLIECNQPKEAIQALDEMARIWFAAVQGEHPNIKDEDALLKVQATGAARPTIKTVNAAVSGLLRKRKPEAAHSVLAWADRLGIAPDVVTYNTLLRGLVRDGQSADAMALLDQMHSQGIEADVATFTTILDGVLTQDDQISPSEQNRMISKILHEMEVVGVKPNLHTYSKIIYQLLELSKGSPDASDLTAVNAVLERMKAQGLQPSAYINTILIEHHFAQDPPNLHAVRSLTERSQREVGSVDHIFWDRVIEGYARIGDTVSAMRVLGKVSTGGSKARASWNTLETLLEALSADGKWDVARELVRDAGAESGGPLKDDERGKEGQHRFWMLAAELKLMGQ